jgi:perosamine synthetase
MIEDSCEAIGATYLGKSAGTFGQTGVFAFYPNKQLTTGEGGIIVTNDDDAAKKCRSWRNQGRSDSNAWLEHENLGYNYRLSDINCALGTSQLKRLPQVVAARAQAAALYNQALQGFDAVIPPALEEPNATISWFVYVIRLADEFSQEDRDLVLSYLKAHGVGCRNYFSPIHLQPFFVERFGYRKGDFPVTEFVSERTIALPFHNRLSEGEIDYVCTTLREAISGLRRGRQFAAEVVSAA